jgi:hypothetical protein
MIPRGSSVWNERSRGLGLGGQASRPMKAAMTDFRSPSFDPKNGLFIVSPRESYSLYFAKPAGGVYGWAGADYGLWSRGRKPENDRFIPNSGGVIVWAHLFLRCL